MPEFRKTLTMETYGRGQPFFKRGTLTNAQILSSNSAPIDAIPAVDNQIIIPEWIILRANYIAGYNLSRNVLIRYAGIAVDISSTTLGAIATTPQSNTMFIGRGLAAVFASAVDLRGVRIQILNSAGDVTGGGPDNTLDYLINYRAVIRP